MVVSRDASRSGGQSAQFDAVGMTHARLVRRQTEPKAGDDHRSATANEVVSPRPAGFGQRSAVRAWKTKVMRPMMSQKMVNLHSM